jgi:hypothetical protein
MSEGERGREGDDPRRLLEGIDEQAPHSVELTELAMQEKEL